MDDTDIAKRYLEYCSTSPKPMSLNQYVARFENKGKTRKKRVGKVIDCASKLMQAIDQIRCYYNSYYNHLLNNNNY